MGHRKSLCLADRSSWLMFLTTVVQSGGSLRKRNVVVLGLRQEWCCVAFSLPKQFLAALCTLSLPLAVLHQVIPSRGQSVGFWWISSGSAERQRRQKRSGLLGKCLGSAYFASSILITNVLCGSQEMRSLLSPPKSQGSPKLDLKSKTLEQIPSGEWRLNGPQG